MREWTWCHCWVPLQGAIVVGRVTNFEGVDVVPLQGAIVVCYGWGAFFLYIDNPKLVFAIWGLCWYNYGIFPNEWCKYVEAPANTKSIYKSSPGILRKTPCYHHLWLWLQIVTSTNVDDWNSSQLTSHLWFPS